MSEFKKKSKSMSITDMKALIAALQKEVVGERDTVVFMGKISEINSLSVDLDNARKQVKYKGCSEFVPERIEIYI